MSGSGRRHSSKWDLKEESSVHDNWLPGKGGLAFHDKESQRGWLPPEAAGGTRLKWSILEPLPGRRGSLGADSIDEDRNRSSKAVTTWGGDESYGTRMSPGFDKWRQQNHHSSPRNEWKRSRRSRTRSQSRSRSRSPARGIGRDSGLYDRSRSRVGASAQFCKDFAAGRCRKGIFRPFLHQNTLSYDDDVSETPRTTKTPKYLAPHDSRECATASGRSAADCCTDFLKGNCRRGSSCRFPHHSASHAVGKGSSNEVNKKRKDRRHRDTSLEKRGDREPRRAADIPCKFFASGNCRNGKSCRFFHQNLAQYSPERPLEARPSLDQHSDDSEKFWNCPKWGTICTSDGAKYRKDVTISASDERDIARSADGWRRWEDKAHEGPLADHKMVESEKALLWKTEYTGDNVVASDQAASKNWLGDMDMSPEWNYKVQPSDHDKQEHTGLTNCNPGTTPEASGQVHDVTAVIPLMNVSATDLHDYNLTEVGACALPQLDMTAMGKAASSRGSTPADIFPAESFKQNGLTANALSLPALNGFEQAPVTIPISGSGINPLNQTVLQDGKIISKPEMGGTDVSKGSSGLPMTQKLVSSEQLNQLTNISASLAQLLANGQQLPQLYAVHNSLTPSSTEISSSTNSEGLVKSQSAVTIRSSQHTGLEQQYDPISDSLDTKQHDSNNNPPGFLPNLIKQKNVVEGKPEMSSKSSSPSASGAPNGTDPRKSLSLQEPNGKSYRFNETEPGANLEAKKQTDGAVMGENRKVAEENAEEDGAIENIDGDGKIDEEKRNKDVKGVLAFKFALVVFVKELLKPTWKEGQMSKDAYKNIVKKVVDKVTGTMQGANIPQTQEKIQQYLSFSKPKLTKLVQAYVEKFEKDK